MEERWPPSRERGVGRRRHESGEERTEHQHPSRRWRGRSSPNAVLPPGHAVRATPRNASAAAADRDPGPPVGAVTELGPPGEGPAASTVGSRAGPRGGGALRMSPWSSSRRRGPVQQEQQGVVSPRAARRVEQGVHDTVKSLARRWDPWTLGRATPHRTAGSVDPPRWQIPPAPPRSSRSFLGSEGHPRGSCYQMTNSGS